MSALFDGAEYVEAQEDEASEPNRLGMLKGYASESFFEAECLERGLPVARPAVDYGIDRIVNGFTVQVKRGSSRNFSFCWHIFVRRASRLDHTTWVAKNRSSITNVDFYALHAPPAICGEHRWWIVPSETIETLCSRSGQVYLATQTTYRVRSVLVLGPCENRWDLLQRQAA